MRRLCVELSKLPHEIESAFTDDDLAEWAEHFAAEAKELERVRKRR